MSVWRALPRFYSHIIKRKDGIFQSYRMRVWVLGENYRQLPRTRVLQRKFGRRVRAYEKTKKIAAMWRLTVAVNRLTRKGKEGIVVVIHKYYSITTTFWSMSKTEAENKYEEAKRRIWELAVKTCKHKDWSDWNDWEPNMALQSFSAGESHTRRVTLDKFEDFVLDVT